MCKHQHRNTRNIEDDMNPHKEYNNALILGCEERIDVDEEHEKEWKKCNILKNIVKELQGISIPVHDLDEKNCKEIMIMKKNHKY